jgi:hypothetical protein
MRTDRRANLAYEPNSTIENVIFLESAFEIHAWLLCCLEYRLRRCVSQGRMLPSKFRQFQDLAEKSGISQLRVMVEAAEQVLEHPHAPHHKYRDLRVPAPAHSGPPSRGALLTDPSRGQAAFGLDLRTESLQSLPLGS